MNKNNGFTLIEVLAVIIILGLISVLVVPNINSMLDNSKKNLSYENARRVVKSFNEYYARVSVNSGFHGCNYNFDGSYGNCDGFQVNGNLPDSGVINIYSNGDMNGFITYDGYSYLVDNGDLVLVDDSLYSSYVFEYTGNEQFFSALHSGYYKLEAWGAQGGDATDEYIGGYGGYSTGTILLSKDDRLFINVGGQGCSGSNSLICGGYNGGGTGITASSADKSGGGGGATHIALKSGILSSLENNKESILIVAGGGGGAYYFNDFKSSGGSGGGFNGSIAPNGTCGQGRVLNTGSSASQSGFGGSNWCGTQIGSNAGFGIGASNSEWSSGGGSGFYGGGAGFAHGANGGSGYIGNSLLADKYMVCFDCSESNDLSTKTISVNDEAMVTSEPISGNPKKGNGYVKITYLGFNME